MSGCMADDEQKLIWCFDKGQLWPIYPVPPGLLAQAERKTGSIGVYCRHFVLIDAMNLCPCGYPWNTGVRSGEVRDYCRLDGVPATLG